MDFKNIDRVNTKPYWQVIYVRQKYERAVSTKLEEIGIENLLPLTKVVREYKSQKRKVIVPMFPGYLFVNAYPGRRHHITNINGVYNFVKIGNDYQRVQDWEIQNIKILTSNMGKYSDLRSEEYIRRGTKVEVKEGPLAGMKGQVTGANGNRLLVSIDSIRTSISISVLQDLVEVRSA